MNKKIIEKMIKDTEKRIEEEKEALIATELMERFARRRVILKPVQGDQMLLETTRKINSLKVVIQTDEEFLDFLREVKNEK